MRRSIAAYDDARQAQLLADRRIIRNRAKVRAFRDNARGGAASCVRRPAASTPTCGASSGAQPIVNHFETMAQIPTQTPLAEEVSADLKRRGFRFVGPVIVYAYLQSAGLVNDHLRELLPAPRRLTGRVPPSGPRHGRMTSCSPTRHCRM